MLQFLSHSRGQRRLFNGLLLTQEIPDEKNYKHGLCHSFYARIN